MSRGGSEFETDNNPILLLALIAVPGMDAFVAQLYVDRLQGPALSIGVQPKGLP